MTLPAPTTTPVAPTTTPALLHPGIGSSTNTAAPRHGHGHAHDPGLTAGPSAHRKPPRHPRATAVAGAIAVAGAVFFGGVLGPAQAAQATDARVTVTLESDPSVVDTAYTDQPTKVSVVGSGFQSIQAGFGGIYLLFGWVDVSSAWQPSAGGTTGLDYTYAMDDETNPVGYQQFISFPGGSTEAQANGELNADGTFAATLTIAGTTFQATDRDGNVSTVDCLDVQCGVITIGAHGVANANNETFTPIVFVPSIQSPSEAAAGSTQTPASTPDPMMTTQVDSGAHTSATAPDAATSTDAATTNSTSSGSPAWMLGSGIALAALLGVGVWRLIVWRRRHRTTL